MLCESDREGAFFVFAFHVMVINGWKGVGILAGKGKKDGYRFGD
jgi:hypothetical protein